VVLATTVGPSPLEPLLLEPHAPTANAAAATMKMRIVRTSGWHYSASAWRHTDRVLPIAHAGHWVIWILYAVPVLIVLGSIVVQLRRERCQDAPSEDEPSDV
jgi:hypothetical protein